jgi:YesN/AraC family two-component response regulator
LSYEVLKEELNDYYFDQAHFSKEFKRMTGYSPRRFTLEVSNEFGRRLAAE